MLAGDGCAPGERHANVTTMYEIVLDPTLRDHLRDVCGVYVTCFASLNKEIGVLRGGQSWCNGTTRSFCPAKTCRARARANSV